MIQLNILKYIYLWIYVYIYHNLVISMTMAQSVHYLFQFVHIHLYQFIHTYLSLFHTDLSLFISNSVYSDLFESIPHLAQSSLVYFSVLLSCLSQYVHMHLSPFLPKSLCIYYSIPTYLILLWLIPICSISIYSSL